jgi:thiol-disulfide isomerase/thioredoxin
MMKKKLSLNKWKISTIILAIALIVSLVFLIKPSFGSPQKIGEDTISYINQNLLGDGIVATLEGIDKSETIKGMYDIKLNIQGYTYNSFVSGDGRYLFVDAPIDMSEGLSGGTQQEDLPEMLEKESTEVEGGFKEITELDVCMENDKPIVYFFGSETCPYCEWEKPLITDVVAQFGDEIDYRVRYDGAEDVDVLLKYGNGAVPAIIAGCKYYRSGAGQSLGEEGEKEALTKVICRATGGIPSSVCGG